MIQFETIDDVACLKDSEDLIQIVNGLLSFIIDKGGKGEIRQQTIILNDNKFYFNLTVTIPIQNKRSS